MSQKHPVDPEDPIIAALIRIKAAQIARSKAGPTVSREDIAQDLVVDLLVRRQKYNPALANPLAFARMIIDRAVGNIGRALRARKRHPPALPEESMESCIDRRQEEADAERDLVIDVREATAQLPDELQDVAELRSTGTVVEVARKLGLSRATVHKRITRMRKPFARKGLEIYLQNPPDTSESNRVVT